jgi:hypothetical protein
VSDSETISKITAEKELTGEDGPMRGDDTAKTQHDITEGEKKISNTRGEGGPTSTAQ